MAEHNHRLKRTADKHAKLLRAKGYKVTVSKRTHGYCVYSYR